MIDYVQQRRSHPNELVDHFESLLTLLRATHARSTLHPLALDLIEALHLLPARWGHWSEWEIELRFAAHLAEQLGQPDRQAVFLANLAHVLITLGQLDETITTSTLAIELARQQQSIEPWVVAGAALIAAYLSRGDTEQAQHVWARLDAERHSFVTTSAAARRIAQAQLGLQHIDFLNRSGKMKPPSMNVAHSSLLWKLYPPLRLICWQTFTHGAGYCSITSVSTRLR